MWADVIQIVVMAGGLVLFCCGMCSFENWAHEIIELLKDIRDEN